MVYILSMKTSHEQAAKRISQAMQGSPLGVSVLALVAGACSFSVLSVWRESGPYFDWGAFAIASLSLCLSTCAVINLIRAEMRGYSSTRIGLSVTALFFSYPPSLSLMMALLRHIGEPP